MCTEDRNSTSTKEEAPPIYFQEDLRWGYTTEAGVWMRNMERGPNFKAAELTKNILSTASPFPFLHYRNDSITLHLCYFSKYACVKPQNICTTSCQTPRLALGTISQEFLPGAYSQSDIDSYFLLATSNNSVEWITS